MRPDGPLVWLHGASVGEGLSLLPLVARFRILRPDVGVLVTTGTRASAEVLTPRLPPGAFHQFAPVDTPDSTARFVGHWRPSLAVFVESELWPNLIFAARRSGARLALVSAKMSDRSFGAWRKFASASRATLGAFDLILARDAQAGARFEALGGAVGGIWDAKLGASPLPADEDELRDLRGVIGDRRAILAASTHPSEEAAIVHAFAAEAAISALLIIVPRHAVRGPEVERIVQGSGLTVARRSAGGGPAGVQVLVADTLGELGLWYRLAALAIIGGSLVEGVGGHNPLEAARLGCPFISGPYVAHWPIYGDLVRAGATRLLDGPDELPAWLRRSLAGDPSLSAMADCAAGFVERRDTQSQAVAPRLLALLAP